MTNCSSSTTIEPGRFRTIELRVNGESYQPPVEWWLNAAVDPNNRVVESNEGNNVTSLTTGETVVPP